MKNEIVIDAFIYGGKMCRNIRKDAYKAITHLIKLGCYNLADEIIKSHGYEITRV